MVTIISELFSDTWLKY